MSTMRERFEKLEPRERRLLGALLGLLGAFVLLLAPILLVTTLSSKRSDNQEIHDLIDTIRESRAKVAERKAKHDALLAKYARPAPPLAGFIESVASAHGITVPESQDRPDLPHGKRYNERSIVVKLHKVGMLALARSLEKIEQSNYPVSITRLSLKPRPGEPDSYEVELGVSAFDRKADAPAKGAAAAPSSSASSAPADEEIP